MRVLNALSTQWGDVMEDKKETKIIILIFTIAFIVIVFGLYLVS